MHVLGGSPRNRVTMKIRIFFFGKCGVVIKKIQGIRSVLEKHTVHYCIYLIVAVWRLLYIMFSCKQNSSKAAFFCFLLLSVVSKSSACCWGPWWCVLCCGIGRGFTWIMIYLYIKLSFVLYRDSVKGNIWRRLLSSCVFLEESAAWSVLATVETEVSLWVFLGPGQSWTPFSHPPLLSSISLLPRQFCRFGLAAW